MPATFSELFESEVFNCVWLSRRMKTRKHNNTERATDDGGLWLDQYPVEVLEAVLNILKAKRGQTLVKKPSFTKVKH
jgi:hypothetical protein